MLLAGGLNCDVLGLPPVGEAGFIGVLPGWTEPEGSAVPPTCWIPELFSTGSAGLPQVVGVVGVAVVVLPATDAGGLFQAGVCVMVPEAGVDDRLKGRALPPVVHPVTATPVASRPAQRATGLQVIWASPSSRTLLVCYPHTPRT